MTQKIRDRSRSPLLTTCDSRIESPTVEPDDSKFESPTDITDDWTQELSHQQ